MSILTTVSDVQRYAKACAAYANQLSDYNFSIEFGMDGQYYTYRRGKTVVIHVPNPSSAMTERDAKIIKSGILHEILHTTEGTSDALDQIKESGIGKLGNDDPLAHIFNIVEDHRIEHEDCKKFDGDAYVLRDAYEIISEEFVKNVKAGKFNTEEFSDQTLKVMGVQLLSLVSREAWMGLGEAADEHFKVSADTSTETASLLVDKGYDDELLRVTTVTEAIDISKRIFEELFEESAEEHIEQNAQAQQGEEQGEEQEGQSGQAQQEKGEGEGEPSDETRMSQSEVDYLEHLRNKREIPDSGGSPPREGQHIDYTSYLESAEKRPRFQPCPLEDIGVADFGANKYHNSKYDIEMTTRRPDLFHKEEVARVFNNHGLQVNSLANKIRRLLQVQSQARWVGGATKGRIHRKSAYRAAMPTIGDGQWNREIFKRRHQDSTLDVAVSVLCDFSGSMGGDKMAHAAFGGYILSDAIGRVLRVPIQVQTFSERSLITEICVLKNWNENSVAEQEYIDRAGRAANTMSQNDDGSAILWTYENLKRRPEKRKVMVVLSDGSPASGRGGDAMGYTQEVVRDIENEGVIEMYGIGIMDENVMYIYKEHDTIDSADEIEGAILNTVKRKLIV